MAQIRPAESDRFVAEPDRAYAAFLVYGPDSGLVAERAGRIAAALAGSDDPFAVTRLESDAVADDPAKLGDAVYSLGLFGGGGGRVVRLRVEGQRSILPALEPVLKSPPGDAWVVIEAGDLRKTAPLRKLCETSRAAATIACYADDERSLDALITEEARREGYTITPDARIALKRLLGADRLTTRGELEKLALYVKEKKSVDIDDIHAAVGEGNAFELDEIVDAVALGDGPALARAWRALLASGQPGFPAASAALRHFQFLHRARAAVERGGAVREIVASAQPPVFFKRRDKVERQLRDWPLARIERAMARLDRAIMESRLHGAIADVVIGETLAIIAAGSPVLRRR